MERSAEAARHETDRGPDVFTRIAEQPERDEEHLVLYRGATCFVVMNRYPYTNGHVLIIPYREVDAYDRLSDEERAEMGSLTAKAIGWIREALSPDAFNVGINQGKAAGAGIPQHLHQHVVPRWHGDTSFMSALGNVRVIPEELKTTFDKIKAALAAS